MADSIRQQIVTNLDTALKTITKLNGYKSDAGKNVFEWLETLTEITALPAIIWRDTDEARAFIGNIQEDRRLTVEIELLAAGTTSPATMRDLLSDITRLVGFNKDWGGLAITTFPVSDTIGTEKEGKRVAGGLVVFEIAYRTKAWDALTQ